MQTIHGYAVVDELLAGKDGLLLHATRDGQEKLLRVLPREISSPRAITKLRYGFDLGEHLAVEGRPLRALIDETAVSLEDAAHKDHPMCVFLGAHPLAVRLEAVRREGAAVHERTEGNPAALTQEGAPFE